MKKIFTGKATRQSVSIPLDMMEVLQEEIQEQGVTFSAYIQKLISANLDQSSHTPKLANQDALLYLFEKFHPTAADDIQKWLGQKEVNQPFFIYQMLCALHESVSREKNIVEFELL